MRLEAKRSRMTVVDMGSMGKGELLFSIVLGLGRSEWIVYQRDIVNTAIPNANNHEAGTPKKLNPVVYTNQNE